MPHYVVSTTLREEDPRWPAAILRSVDEIAARKEAEGGPIAAHDSATLGKSPVFPVLVGAGKRLWSEADKDWTKLRLIEQEAYANGIQKQVFDVVH